MLLNQLPQSQHHHSFTDYRMLIQQPRTTDNSQRYNSEKCCVLSAPFETCMAANHAVGWAYAVNDCVGALEIYTTRS